MRQSDPVDALLADQPQGIDALVAPSKTRKSQGGARATSDKAPRRPRGRPPKTASISAELEASLVLAAQVWSVRDPVCGGALAQTAPEIARSWEAQAKRSPRVRRALEGVMGPAGWAGVLAAHLPLLLTIYQHHAPRPKAVEPEQEQEPQPEPVPEPVPWQS